MNYRPKMKGWRQDKKAKSISYFFYQKIPIVNKKLIDNLKKISKENGNANARLCLHNNPNEKLHDMVILEHQNKKCKRPHRHHQKTEILHLIEGQMVALIFDKEGKLINKTFLDKNNFGYRLPQNQYHVWIPITKYVIYREIKQGPFQQTDNIPLKFNYTEISKKQMNFLNCYNKTCKTPCVLNKIDNETFPE